MANIVPAVPAGILTILLLLHLPHGYQYARAWRDLSPPQVLAHDDFRTGVVLRLTAKAFPSEELQQRYLQAVDDAGFEAINIFLNADIENDVEAQDKAAQLIGELRDRGLKIILTPDFPSEIMTGEHPENARALGERMLPWCTLVARKFRPDYIVPIIEPYGAAVFALGRRVTPEEWHETLVWLCGEIEQDAPDTKCCVYFTPTENDPPLYKLCAAAGVPEVLGFSFYSMGEEPQEIVARLERATRLIEQHGAGIEHWLFEFGHPPVTLGGEAAQVNFTLLALSHFAGNPAFRGACVFAMDDSGEKIGLMNSVGRRRELFHALRKL